MPQLGAVQAVVAARWWWSSPGSDDSRRRLALLPDCVRSTARCGNEPVGVPLGCDEARDREARLARRVARYDRRRRCGDGFRVGQLSAVKLPAAAGWRGRGFALPESSGPGAVHAAGNARGRGIGESVWACVRSCRPTGVRSRMVAAGSPHVARRKVCEGSRQPGCRGLGGAPTERVRRDRPVLLRTIAGLVVVAGGDRTSRHELRRLPVAAVVRRPSRSRAALLRLLTQWRCSRSR